MELKRLKIGRAYYRVRNRELHPDLYGQIDLGRKLLDIADDLEGEEAVYALIHEVLHGVWAHRGMPARLQEERAVTGLAWGLTGVFRDNPGLLMFLDGLLKDAQ